MTYSLTGNKISQTYGKLVQVIDGVYYDGLGNQLYDLPTDYYESIGATSASYSLTLTSNPTQYIGVSYSMPTEIFIPISDIDGKIVTIKDESGSASINPITINSTIDNSPQVTIQIDYGSITIVSRINSWWII